MTCLATTVALLDDALMFVNDGCERREIDVGARMAVSREN